VLDLQNRFEFDWDLDTQEDVDISPGDMLHILRLFSHEKGRADGEVGLPSSGLLLKQCSTNWGEYRRIGFQHLVQRIVFHENMQAVETTSI
jgi:hypothetical protein